ncbi:Hypothetical protein D9617_11g007580 [Elsinoe fawcettii]|nr:Hypothetical protein D9617_11g007580 [Elsinoe fawcettii]
MAPRRIITQQMRKRSPSNGVTRPFWAAHETPPASCGREVADERQGQARLDHYQLNASERRTEW